MNKDLFNVANDKTGLRTSGSKSKKGLNVNINVNQLDGEELAKMRPGETVQSRFDRARADQELIPTRDSNNNVLLEGANARNERGNSHGKSKRLTSAEKQRVGDQEGFEDRFDDMATNIDHFDHHGDAKIKKKSQANARFTGMGQKAMQPDRLEVVRDENLRLKTNYNMLETNVKEISRQFQRQITLLKKERLIGSAGQRTAVTREFEQKFNELIEENSKLSVEEQDYMEKIKKLNAQRKKALAQGKTLFSTVKSATENTSKAERDGANQLRVLQATIGKQKDRLCEIVRQIEGTKRVSSSALHMDELLRERREKEIRVMQAQGRMDDIKASLKTKQDIFGSSKDYEQQLNQQLKQAFNETNALSMQNRTLKQAAQENEDIRERLKDVQEDRDRLQSEFNVIMQQPFFKKHSDENGMRQFEQLQAKVEAKEKEIEHSKSTITKSEIDLKGINQRIEQLSEVKGTYEGEIAKMKAHMDPTSLTLNDVMKKLKNEDPSRFREVMNDLEFEGRDPVWYKMGYEEQLLHLTGKQGSLQLDSIESLNEHKERLMSERSNLVTELNKIQKLLKLQVDLDKQNAARQQAELKIIQSSIRHQTIRSNELTGLIKSYNDKLVTMQEQRGPSGLTTADLQRFNQELSQLKTETKHVQGVEPDAMTEVSARTNESEMLPQENLLDLRITSATFDRVMLTQFLTAGNMELDPSTIQTFLAVDFFNHDTKSTDVTMGLEPIFNTLFSFKNNVDDFYIKFLEKDTILIDIFHIPKPNDRARADKQQVSGAIKLGVAKLPLNKLIEKDYSFQAQEIVHLGKNGEETRIGKIFYRMRPRKPLDEAIKWYKQKTLIKNQHQVDFSAAKKLSSHAADDSKQGQLQIIEIEVNGARGLRISGEQNAYASHMMKPFFTYDFFSFQHASAVVLGTDPNFQDRKKFEVEQTDEFMNYVKNEVFKIDFIDESVEMHQDGARDYIGSARIPLKNLLTRGEISGDLEVRDEYGGITGKVNVRMTLHDAQKHAQMLAMHDSSIGGVMQHKRIHLDVISRISESFADGEFEEIDLYLDMLFMKDTTNMQRVTREMFIDYICVDMRVPQINKRELEIFLRTHELLMQKSLFTREELKSIFERPFKEARLKAARNEAENAGRTNMFNYTRVDNPLLTQKHEPAGFNVSEKPKRANDPFQRANDLKDDDDDFRRATMKKESPRRETFGIVPQDRATVKFQEAAAAGNTTFEGSNLDKAFKKDVYQAITDFVNECGPDYPGAQFSQTKTVLRKFMSRYGPVEENEIIKFHDAHCVGDLLFFRETLLAKYAKPIRLPEAVRRRTPAQVQMLLAIKTKLHAHISRKNFTMDEFIAVMDRNNDKEISLVEFVQQVKTFLNETEATQLFKAIDHDNSQSLTVDEIQIELASITAAQILDKVKATAEENKFEAAELFAVYDQDKSGTMEINEFKEFINQAAQDTDTKLTEYLFKLVDKSSKGYISKEDFVRVMGKDNKEVLQGRVIIQPKDILLPLGTTIKMRLNLSISQAFEKFKSGPDQMSYDALYEMVPFFMGFELQEEEKLVFGQYLDVFAQTKKPNGSIGGILDRSLFEQLFLPDAGASNSIDIAEAKKTYRKIKATLGMKSRSLVNELKNNYMSPHEKRLEEVNVRSLKHALFNLASLHAVELDNCVGHMDLERNGFVKITEIQTKLV